MSDCKKTVFLHVGTSKTGTSSIQAFLDENREWLRQQGYLVPESELQSHQPLARSIVNDHTKKSDRRKPFAGNSESLWNHVIEEIDHTACHTILISAEQFRELYQPDLPDITNAMMTWLGHKLEGLDVKIVCYLRPLGEYVKSQYKQSIKHKLNSRVFTSHVANKINSRSAPLAPSCFLDLFARQFGHANLILRKYDREALVNADIIADFLTLIGVSPQHGSTLLKDNNPSLPDELVDTKRIFNHLSNCPPLKSEYVGQQIAQKWEDSLRNDLSDHETRKICESLQKEHDVIAEQYGLDLGEVQNPFVDAYSGSVESRGTAVLISLLWREVEESRKEIRSLNKKVKKIRRRQKTNILQRVLHYIHRQYRKLTSRSE